MRRRRWSSRPRWTRSASALLTWSCRQAAPAFSLLCLLAAGRRSCQWLQNHAVFAVAQAPQAAPGPAADHASYMLQGQLACPAYNPPGLGRPRFTVLPSVRRSRRSRWPTSTSCG